MSHAYSIPSKTIRFRTSAAAPGERPSSFPGRKTSRKLVVAIGLGALILALGLLSLLGDEPTTASGLGTRLKYSPGRSSDARAGGGVSAGSRRTNGSTVGRKSRPSCASSYEGSGDGGISVQVEFDSPPSVVRNAITRYVKTCYPQAVSYLRWNEAGTAVSASDLGASGSIILSGSGPTVVQICGDIGFPASLFVSEARVRSGLSQAIRDIKKRTS